MDFLNYTNIIISNDIDDSGKILLHNILNKWLK